MKNVLKELLGDRAFEKWGHVNTVKYGGYFGGGLWGIGLLVGISISDTYPTAGLIIVCLGFGAAGFGGLPYFFSAFATANSNPGFGSIRYNSTTMGSITQIYINNNEYGSNTNVSSWITGLTTTGTGYLVVTNSDVPSLFTHIFSVTGVSQQTGYYTLNVSYLAGSYPSSSANIGITYSSAGPQGPTGPSGPTSEIGFQFLLAGM